ncbi:MAG: hypothetical protein GXY23_05670 [Myxococcales bacterium]|nr:hypothetical protein [Myxococcales bacterium]
MVLAAGCGDDGPNDGPGGPVEPPSIYGSWTRACEQLADEAAVEPCLAAPENFVFGPAVLLDPASYAASMGFCGGHEDEEEEIWALGTFTLEGDILTLFNCPPEAPARVFEARWENEGEQLILTGEGTTYVFARKPPAEIESISSRVTDAFRGCDTDSYLDGQISAEGPHYGWLSTLVIQDGEILMDEFFWSSEGPNSFGWGFYSANDRGAQTKDFPLDPGIPTTFYRIFRNEDLTPIHATGFEVNECTAEEIAVRVFEHDFVRGVTFRRFWATSGDLSASLEVDLEGTVEEVIVTVGGVFESAAGVTIMLTSPEGTTVELVSTGTFGADDDVQLDYASFGDVAMKTLPDPDDSSPDQLYVPAESLAKLTGETMAGTWTLTLSRESVEPGDAIYYFGLSLR